MDESELSKLSLVELKEKEAELTKLKEEAWEEATKISQTQKRITSNKAYKDTYINAFKPLTLQLNTRYKEFEA